MDVCDLCYAETYNRKTPESEPCCGPDGWGRRSSLWEWREQTWKQSNSWCWQGSPRPAPDTHTYTLQNNLTWSPSARLIVSFWGGEIDSFCFFYMTECGWLCPTVSEFHLRKCGKTYGITRVYDKSMQNRNSLAVNNTEINSSGPWIHVSVLVSKRDVVSTLTVFLAYFSSAKPWLLKMATLAFSRSFLSMPSLLGMEPTKMAASKSLKATSSLSVATISVDGEIMGNNDGWHELSFSLCQFKFRYVLRTMQLFDAS